MNIFYLLVGSNIDKPNNIVQCHHHLTRKVNVLGYSSVYQSIAIGLSGPLDQSSYFNMAYKVMSNLSLIEFDTDVCKTIEADLGRRRSTDKYAARTIDIDIVLYNNEVVNEGRMIIPDSDLLKFEHVAVPVAELDPKYIHPLTGQTLAEIVEGFYPMKSLQKINLHLI